jgi:hypothetical protein
MNHAITRAAAALAAGALALLPAAAAHAAPQARHGHHVHCDRKGRGLCLTLPRHGDWLRTGPGTPARITAAGRVRAHGHTFRHSPWLNQIFAGQRIVRIRLGRQCAAGTARGELLRRPCPAALWVRNGDYWLSVRASDAGGLPAYLTATSRTPGRARALTLNGYRIPLQEWRTVRRAG